MEAETVEGEEKQKDKKCLPSGLDCNKRKLILSKLKKKIPFNEII